MSAGANAPAAASEALLRVEGLVKHFPVTAGVLGRQVAAVKAVDGISFSVARGRTLGLVGESGCGKSTVGRCVLRLEEPTAGHVYFDGDDIATVPAAELRRIRQELQIVFQDPFSSLNPRMTVADIIAEGIRVHRLASGREAEERVVATLARVGIPAAWINRYPHEFSGGQRQRISIARAIAVDPKLIVCDEAVSALDVSVQAQVLNLLVDLRRDLGLSYLFISHDLSVVRHVSDDVAVMYLGQLVEQAPAAALFERPAHPYTRALLSAIPVPDVRRSHQRTVLEGDVPTPLDPPPGCRFHTRCPAAIERCRHETPPSIDLGGAHRVDCVHAEGMQGQGAEATVQLDERIAAAEVERRRVRSAAAQARADALRSGPPPSSAGTPVATARGGAGKRDGAAGGFAPPWLARAWPPGRDACGVVAGAVACLLGIAGAPWLALVFGLGAAGLLLSTGERVLSVGLGLASGIALSIFVGRALVQAREFHRADADLAALQREIAAFEAERGRLPASLGEMGWRVVAAIGNEGFDPWGGRWRYVQPGSDGAAYDLGSAGPDGAIGSADDVGELGGPEKPLSPHPSREPRA